MTRLYWVLSIVLVVGAFVASAVLYPGLPAHIPTHWDIHGQVDGYGEKTWAVFLMPGVMVGSLGLIALLPWLSPKQFEVDSFRETYLFIMLLVMGLLTYIHALMLLAAKSHGLDVGRALVGGIFLFLALVGNVLGKVRRNFYVGYRLPWTLASDRVWNDTHRLAAWLIVACGLIGCALVVLGAPIAATVVLVIIVAVVPAVYSLIHYKRLQRRGEL